ncbi:Alpha/Beta hydrolase protein [Fomitopsis serialis]|uniref:Alpha/Beta hydrolase protein n=1 Tax=Fomitopsis serialis TaxID=139415 RepID=UPI002007BBF4|nr:Alpha/Beta hydrolase protein [Neoantrodia serialis]KAH9916902.1 Alpha/Beta hydrolase protein [Neoantrodia serialis]
MDRTSYKEITTKRSIKYSYYSSSGDASKPTLLFVHGFPSTSYDWRNQVAFFKAKGHSIIAPDMLGYGGTDKPAETALYKHSAMCADVIDILDAENVSKAIVIGHDWGAPLVGHLAVRYRERFLAFAFLAVGYTPSFANFNYETAMATVKQAIGYEPYGYWRFFVEEGTDQVMKDHLESTLGIIHPADPATWKEDLCVPGAAKAALLADKRTPIASYVTPEVKQHLTDMIVKDGLGGALNWYKVILSGLAAEDDKGIPQERLPLPLPVLYIGGKQDCVNPSALALRTSTQLCSDLTVKELDTGHWLQLEAPDEVNETLKEWVETVEKKAKL